ncbi:hypothetical protein ACPXB3_22240, partial [Gordonia sp. DT219]|uniref:hypothetical protein n=1 Tax=Gordonia sp. DT219 TaxID=3416658 RepID=UPI003CF2DFB8
SYCYGGSAKGVVREADAEFIAAAPDLVRELLSEVERARIRAIEWRNERDEARRLTDRNEKWSNECLPGGVVCAECGWPVESEPCELHGTGPEIADIVRGQLADLLQIVQHGVQYDDNTICWDRTAETVAPPNADVQELDGDA